MISLLLGSKLREQLREECVHSFLNQDELPIPGEPHIVLCGVCGYILIIFWIYLELSLLTKFCELFFMKSAEQQLPPVKVTLVERCMRDIFVGGYAEPKAHTTPELTAESLQIVRLLVQKFLTPIATSNWPAQWRADPVIQISMFFVFIICVS